MVLLFERMVDRRENGLLDCRIPAQRKQTAGERNKKFRRPTNAPPKQIVNVRRRERVEESQGTDY